MALCRVLRRKVIVLLQDDANELTFDSSMAAGGVSEGDIQIGDAVSEFSEDTSGYEASATVNGTGGDITLTSGAVYAAMIRWDNPGSFITKIECPIQTTGELVYLYPGTDFVLTPEGDDVPTAIRFLTYVPPSGTNNVRIYYRDIYLYLFPPGSLSLSTVGTAGSTVYGYRVTSVDASGNETLACPEVRIHTGNATLSGTNYVTATWDDVPGASTYNIYRITGGATQGRLSTGITSPTYNDQGSAASGSAPAVDSTTIPIGTRNLRVVSYKGVANCLSVLADKKAFNTDADLDGTSVDLSGQADRLAARAEYWHSRYKEAIKPDSEDVQAGFADKTFNPPGSGDTDWQLDEFNETGVTR